MIYNTCPKCGNEVEVTQSTCPYCGSKIKPLKTKKRMPAWGIALCSSGATAVIFAAVILIIGANRWRQPSTPAALVSSTTTTTTAPRPEQTVKPTQSASATSTAQTSSVVSVPPAHVATSFFSSKENREMYEDCYKSYKYSELQAYIKKYISESKPDKNDVAYTILGYIEPLIPYEDNWDVYLDEFDNKYALTYGYVIEVDYENSFSLLLKETNLDIQVGFARNDWLFFDKIELSIDGEKAYSKSVKSYDCTRNVIPPDSVEEYCACSFNDNVLDALGKADTAIIRFSNKKSGEIYDHTLTKEEKDALYCGKHLRDNNRELSNLIINYREDNNIKDE